MGKNLDAMLVRIRKNNLAPEANYLHLTGELDTYDVLVTLLSDTDDQIKYVAAKALGLLGDKRALVVLGQIAESTDVYLSEIANLAIGRILRMGLEQFLRDVFGSEFRYFISGLGNTVVCVKYADMSLDDETYARIKDHPLFSSEEIDDMDYNYTEFGFVGNIEESE